MTNSEIEQALYCAKESAENTLCEECKLYETCDHSTRKDIAQIWVEALEENTRLKAEIDQLKIEPDKEALDDAFDLGYQACLRHNGVCWKDAEEIQKLRKEIERLKSELEQSVKLQIVLSKLLFGTEFARCYMCDNSMKNITLDGKNNGCDGSCYHEKNYTENDFIEKIKCEFDRIERRKQ